MNVLRSSYECEVEEFSELDVTSLVEYIHEKAAEDNVWPVDDPAQYEELTSFLPHHSRERLALEATHLAAHGFLSPDLSLIYGDGGGDQPDGALPDSSPLPEDLGLRRWELQRITAFVKENSWNFGGRWPVDADPSIYAPCRGVGKWSVHLNCTDISTVARYLFESGTFSGQVVPVYESGATNLEALKSWSSNHESQVLDADDGSTDSSCSSHNMTSIRDPDRLVEEHPWRKWEDARLARFLSKNNNNLQVDLTPLACRGEFSLHRSPEDIRKRALHLQELSQNQQQARQLKELSQLQTSAVLFNKDAFARFQLECAKIPILLKNN